MGGAGEGELVRAVVRVTITDEDVADFVGDGFEQKSHAAVNQTFRLDASQYQSALPINTPPKPYAYHGVDGLSPV